MTFGKLPSRDVLDRVRDVALELAELAGQRRIDGAAVEQVEAQAARGPRGMLGGDAQAGHDQHGQGGLVVLADDQQVAAALADGRRRPSGP